MGAFYGFKCEEDGRAADFGFLEFLAFVLGRTAINAKQATTRATRLAIHPQY